MSLLEEARAAEHHAGGSCSVANYLPDAELEEALAAVRHKLFNEPGPQLDGAALERALAKRGNPLRADTIRRHAKGECSCAHAA